jgi:predicted Zn-dependent peptidase
MTVNPQTPLSTDSACFTTLANGVRLVALPLPHVDTVCVSVFVRTGSRDEPLRLNGISHVVEHMAFKGTSNRNCQQINLDAEALGAEVNAHTDKDHTAYHMRGLAADLPAFIDMLAEIVLDSTFPEAELERERQVILQEFAEDEEDAFSTASKLFDKACFGKHPVAQPVIGLRRNIERFSSEDLRDYVRRQYVAGRIVVAMAGRLDAPRALAQAARAFASAPVGETPAVDGPAWAGGLLARRVPGVSQTHVVLGFPIPSLLDDGHVAAQLAAAVLGEGMSSPLLDEIRERRGLAYYVACSADLSDLAGQFVLEASMAPEHVEEFAQEVVRLMRAHADAIDPLHLERARRQITVRRLESQERPFRLIEEAVQDVYLHGRVRDAVQRLAPVQAVPGDAVRACFGQMLARPAAAGLAGAVRKSTVEALKQLLTTLPN